MLQDWLKNSIANLTLFSKYNDAPESESEFITKFTSKKGQAKILWSLKFELKI
jgi:hypothetical protein